MRAVPREDGLGQCVYARAVSAFSHVANFRKALALLNALPDTPERTKPEIEIQLAIGIPIIAVQGYAAAETREACALIAPAIRWLHEEANTADLQRAHAVQGALR
jgi:hypothetical protein